MSGARFILSLDCEGKWGIADHLGPRDHELLSDARLQRAYRDIIALLDRHEVPATFAVVGLFVEPKDALASLPHSDLAEQLPYTRAAMQALAAGEFDGWCGNWLRAMLGEAHEWASHGVTHTPYDQMTADDVRLEHALVSPVAGQTFIFPRNRIGHLDVLAELGVTGYRLAACRGRIARLMGEFQMRTPSEADPLQLPHAPVAIPAGHFVNWKSGGRKLVPVAVSRKRAAAMLDHAVKTGGVVHYWTHPENVATAPDTLSVLSAIVQEAAIRARRGEIRILTQADYVAEQIVA